MTKKIKRGDGDPLELKCKRGPLGVFEHPFFCKRKTCRTLWRHENLRKKVSQSRKKHAQKIFQVPVEVTSVAVSGSRKL